MVYPQATHRRGQCPYLQHLRAIGDLALRPRKERDEAAVDQPKMVMTVATEAGKAVIDCVSAGEAATVVEAVVAETMAAPAAAAIIAVVLRRCSPSSPSLGGDFIELTDPPLSNTYPCST